MAEHRATTQFWKQFYKLPEETQKLARKNFELLKENPRYPSLRFKKIFSFWSARVGTSYRALAVEDGSGFIWVWIGSHDEYNKLLSRKN